MGAHAEEDEEMASRFCPKCGTPRIAAFRFCRSCGLDYDAVEGASPSVAVSASDVPPAPSGQSSSLPPTPGAASVTAVAATPDAPSPSDPSARSTWEETWHRWEPTASVGLLIAFAVFCLLVFLVGPQG